MPEEHVPSDDPLNLEAVDQAIRINELSERVRELGSSEMHVSDDCPPEAHEQFLSNIIAYESNPLISHFDQLVKRGVDLPPPDSLGDAELASVLQRVIAALAETNTFLSHTDHLSDRQLYEELWSDVLREEYPDMSASPGWEWHLDILGGCSEEDMQISLRYYHTEEERAHWARDFPNDVIPPHEKLPYDRDRFLPQPPPDEPGFEDDDDPDIEDCDEK
ncbi:MAG TPA: hypothetical protein VG797_03680 [Phycisphaerales bacterium]|nr:hypothetical protein [Phycisphaerales bacterium]